MRAFVGVADGVATMRVHRCEANTRTCDLESDGTITLNDERRAALLLSTQEDALGG